MRPGRPRGGSSCAARRRPAPPRGGASAGRWPRARRRPGRRPGRGPRSPRGRCRRTRPTRRGGRPSGEKGVAQGFAAARASQRAGSTASNGRRTARSTVIRPPATCHRGPADREARRSGSWGTRPARIHPGAGNVARATSGRRASACGACRSRRRSHHAWTAAAASATNPGERDRRGDDPARRDGPGRSAQRGVVPPAGRATGPGRRATRRRSRPTIQRHAAATRRQHHRRDHDGAHGRLHDEVGVDRGELVDVRGPRQQRRGPSASTPAE